MASSVVLRSGTARPAEVGLVSAHRTGRQAIRRPAAAKSHRSWGTRGDCARGSVGRGLVGAQALQGAAAGLGVDPAALDRPADPGLAAGRRPSCGPLKQLHQPRLALVVVVPAVKQLNKDPSIL